MLTATYQPPVMPIMPPRPPVLGMFGADPGMPDMSMDSTTKAAIIGVGVVFVALMVGSIIFYIKVAQGTKAVAERWIDAKYGKPKPTTLGAAFGGQRGGKKYIVYVNGEEQKELISASGHNAAEKKAQQKHPGKQVMVAYTEV